MTISGIDEHISSTVAQLTRDENRRTTADEVSKRANHIAFIQAMATLRLSYVQEQNNG